MTSRSNVSSILKPYDYIGERRDYFRAENKHKSYLTQQGRLRCHYDYHKGSRLGTGNLDLGRSNHPKYSQGNLSDGFVIELIAVRNRRRANEGGASYYVLRRGLLVDLNKSKVYLGKRIYIEDSYMIFKFTIQRMIGICMVTIPSRPDICMLGGVI